MMFPRHRWVLAGTLLAAAACRSYEARPLALQAQLAALAERSARTMTGAFEAPPVDLDWFPLCACVDPEDGVDLAEAGRIALAYAPAVLEARSAARLAGIQLAQAGLLPNPELFVGPRLEEGGAWILPASLAFQIPYTNERDARRDEAATHDAARRLSVIAAEVETLARVRHLFVELAGRGQQAELLTEIAAESAALADWAEQMQDVGEADALSVSLLHLEWREAEQLARDRRFEQESAAIELCALIGLLPEAASSLVRDPSTLRLPPLPPADRSRLLRHPRLAASEAEYRAAEHRLRQEIARQYPDLHFGPDFESDDGTLSLGLGIRLPLPLFDHNQEAIHAADEARLSAREAYDRTLLELTREEHQARREFAAATELFAAHRASTTELIDIARTALEQRLSSRQASVPEIVTMRRAITAARLRVIEQRMRAAHSAIDAALASGIPYATLPHASLEVTRP